MKHVLTLVFVFFYFFSVQAQILNNNINAEIRIAEFYGNSDNDATSTDEQSMLITYLWTATGSTTEAGPFCTFFDCHADCELPEDIPNGLFAYSWAIDFPYETAIDFRLHAWGDEEGDDCTFDPGDIDEYNGLASEETLINNIITDGRAPVEWNFDFGSVDNWIFYDNGLFDLKPKACWRFAAGEDCTNPLNFGTIASGETKTHVNVNKTAPEGGSGDIQLGYSSTDLGDNSSPDVYYSFTITEPSMVTISTNNDATDYDTYIKLFEAGCGTQITVNDDIISGNTKSQIDYELIAGTYTVLVEGYSSEQGTFELSVSAASIVSSVHAIDNDIAVQIGPNPTSDELRIIFSNAELLKDASYKLFNTNGQLLEQEVIRTISTVLDLNQYTPAIYLLHIITDQGSKVEKVILQ